MSAIRIVKYCYAKQGSFKVEDEYGHTCYIVFENIAEEAVDHYTMYNFKPIQIENGY